MNEIIALLNIIRNYIKNEKCCIDVKVDENKLYEIAEQNKVSNFLKYWADEYATDSMKNKVQMDFNKQILKDTNQSIEFENLLNKFEQLGIKTLIFKGFLTKSLYPQDYMRKMCDIDILVEKKDFKKAAKAIRELGFKKLYDHEKHLIFVKNVIVIVEVHREMTTPKDVGYEYFINVWDNCIKYKGYKNIYQMNLEDNYIFCIVHLLIHFKDYGINIRDILDVYLYNENFKDKLNYKKINEEFEKLEIKNFEKELREIAYKWCDYRQELYKGIQNKEFSDIEKYILEGPSLNKKVLYSIINNMNKENKIFGLFFPKLKVMQYKYPVLRKSPYLLPFMWIYRMVKGIFEKTFSIKDRLQTLELVKNVKEEDIKRVKDIYKKLGI